MCALLADEGKMFSKHHIQVVFAAHHNPSISFVSYEFRVVF